MTTPPPGQSENKTLTPALLTAIAAVIILAVVTVIVVVTGGDDDESPNGSPSTSAGPTSESDSASGSADSSSANPDDPATVTDDEFGVQYTYPMNGYDEFDWAGPGDMTAGIVDFHSMVSYAACKYEAGSDLLFGLVASDETDLAQAAKIVAVDMSKSVWANSGEATTTDPTDASEKTTDSDIAGQLVEIESTRANGEADECGTTTTHIASFAFENGAGDVVVMVASYRTDGEALKDAGAFADDVTATFKSIALV